ncbi:MAG TPA: sulfatase-like hydrolase/transferase [Candidatus Polarisedimenticolaceae bacterium]|nr:sulfatase-like hydrolase/transferase [Candidatus Polarisedimenticolaceae bacterium]
MGQNRLLGLLATGLVLAACDGPAPRPAAPPSSTGDRWVLLLTIDTWRADYVGAAGKLAVRTPTFDTLAREGWYLPRVHSSAPLTTPAHATILTGWNPYRHRIRDNIHYRLAPAAPTLAEAFRQAGYRTAAFVSATPLRRGVGLDRGFDVYDDGALERSAAESVENAERRGDKTLARIQAWLDRSGPMRRLFLWVHLYDPHFPYRAPPSPGPAPVNAYAGEVEFVDRLTSELLAMLRARAPQGSLSVMLTGDHGEGLGEHGEQTHGIALYDATLLVPWILWPKPAAGPPRQDAALVDLAPTLRAWSGLPAADGDGRSLLSASGSGEPRWLYAEALSPTWSFGISPAYALRRGAQIAMLHGGGEVYDTERDPAQLTDMLPGAGEPFYREAERQLAAWQSRYPEGDAREATATPTEEELAKLHSLGYVGGTKAAAQAPWQTVDRRNFLRDFAALQRARDAFRTRDYGTAVAGFRQFLATYPRAPQAQQELGMALVRLRRFDEAEEQFERALSLEPEDPGLLLNLGALRVQKGDMLGARDYLQRALAADPEQPEALLNLAHIHIAAGDLRGAAPYLQKFLEVAPDDREADKIRGLLRQAGAAPAR